MKLSILYNWPVGKDLAVVSFGMQNTEDPKYQFRLSVLDKGKSDEWFSSEWVNYDEVDKLNVTLSKNSKIRFNKKDTESDLVKKFELDFSIDWPPEACGATTVDAGYWI